MGFAQHYRSEGEQLGIKRGILIGEGKSIPQGEAQDLCRQLTRRFGPLRIPVGAIHECPYGPTAPSTLSR